VERDDRAPVGTFFAEPPLVSDGTATLGEHAAHHARVKRLSAGDPLRLTDGAGRVARGSIVDIQRSALRVSIDRVETIDPPPPIHLRVPIADRDRMLWLGEKATELGITSWQAVRFRRSASVSPRGEGDGFHEKLRARMVSALEQSGGAWLPTVLPETTLAELGVRSNESAIVLDLAGEPLASVIAREASRAPVLLLGPEGGIEPDEMALLTARGWRAATLAATTLRFETAGIAGIAVIRAAQLRTGS
jgi:16S rRNA (uracil1498-N3)-methyltransferase